VNALSFFKKWFKDDTEGITAKDEDDVINTISGELIAENSIRDGNNGTIDTNKLPEIPLNIITETYKGFSNYLFFSESNCGMVRNNNQDSIFTGVFKYNVANQNINSGIGIVADGMGGLSMGEVASSTVITVFSTYMCARLSEYVQDAATRGLPHSQVILGHISDAIKNTNSIVWDKGAALGEVIGTTFTGVVLLGNTAYFGHVGDSRGYIINIEDKTIEKITRDHSLVGRLVEMGQITEKDAKSHPRRNEIYKMLGLRNEIEVDTYYRIINKNSIILLMSDGLWEFVDDDYILDVIIKNNDYSIAVKAMIDLANKNGGYDNISVVIIKPIE
jgi:PPM family protein phosphatase